MRREEGGEISASTGEQRDGIGAVNGRTLRRRSFGRDELDYDGHVAARETLSVAGRPLPVFRIELRVAQRGQKRYSCVMKAARYY